MSPRKGGQTSIHITRKEFLRASITAAAGAVLGACQVAPEMPDVVPSTPLSTSTPVPATTTPTPAPVATATNTPPVLPWREGMYEIDREILADARARIARDRKWDVRLQLAPPGNVSLSGSRVTVALTRHAFRFGCNGFQLTVLEGADLRQGYEERFDALLNYATLPFYWGSYEPTQGVTRESTLRQMAAWCQEHNVATKGHPLVWHEVYPRWPAALPDEEVLRLQRQRVTDLVSGFRGLVDTWDVVNEATVSHQFDNAVGRYVGRQPAAAVDEMLRLAHDANPDAELLYNDFNVRDPSCDKLVSDLIERESPMSAIGIQSHMHART